MKKGQLKVVIAIVIGLVIIGAIVSFYPKLVSLVEFGTTDPTKEQREKAAEEEMKGSIVTERELQKEKITGTRDEMLNQITDKLGDCWDKVIRMQADNRRCAKLEISISAGKQELVERLARRSSLASKALDKWWDEDDPAPPGKYLICGDFDGDIEDTDLYFTRDLKFDCE